MRRHYRHDGLPGLAFKRALEGKRRPGYWRALASEIGRARFWFGLVVAGAALAFILFAGAFA